MAVGIKLWAVVPAAVDCILVTSDSGKDIDKGALTEPLPSLGGDDKSSFPNDSESNDDSGGEGALAEPLHTRNDNIDKGIDNASKAISGKARSDDSYDQEHSNDDDTNPTPSAPGEEAGSSDSSIDSSDSLYRHTEFRRLQTRHLRLMHQKRLNGLLDPSDGSSSEGALAEPLHIINGNNESSIPSALVANSDPSKGLSSGSNDSNNESRIRSQNESNSDLASEIDSEADSALLTAATRASSKYFFAPSPEFLANLDRESLVSEFHDAIRQGDYAKSYSCIWMGVDINATDDKHKTAMQILLESEGGPDAKILSLLLDNGADARLRDENDEIRDMYYYPKYNSSNADDEFWQKVHSSKFNEYLSDSVPLFGINARGRDADDLRQEFLHFMEEIERKGDWHILFHENFNPSDVSTVLHWLFNYLPDISMDLIKRIVEIYERFGMPNMLWVPDKFGWTVPDIAAWKGNLELVKFFVSKCKHFGKVKGNVAGPDCDPKYNKQRQFYPTELTPNQQFKIVMSAAKPQQYDVVDYLLEFFQDRDILRLLIHVPHYNHDFLRNWFDSSSVRYVLTKFDVEFVNGKHFGGLTALHLAVMHVDGVDARSNYADCFYSMVVVRELIDYFTSCDKPSYINTPDVHGRTALDIILHDCVRLRKNVELLKSNQGKLSAEIKWEIKKSEQNANEIEIFAQELRDKYGFKSGIQPTSSSGPPGVQVPNYMHFINSFNQFSKVHSPKMS